VEHVVTPKREKFWDARTHHHTHVPPVKRRRPPPGYDHRDLRHWIPLDAFIAIKREIARQRADASGREDVRAAERWARIQFDHDTDMRRHVERILEVGHWYAARPGQIPPRELRYDLEVIVSKHSEGDGDSILRAAVMLEQWPALPVEARDRMRDHAFDVAVLWCEPSRIVENVGEEHKTF
jgi:hypothetical protein